MFARSFERGTLHQQITTAMSTNVSRRESHVQSAGDITGDRILERKNVRGRIIKCLAPDYSAIRHIEQLDGNSDPVMIALDRSRDDGVHLQTAACIECIRIGGRRPNG
jgi:hypothetical protein